MGYKSVLVVGVGSLGSRVVVNLPEVISKIGISDGDIITDKNKMSQPLYASAGTSGMIRKADFAAQAIRDLYGSIEICSYPFYIGESRARDIVLEYDLILDFTDNMRSRMVLNSACAELSKPILFASMNKKEGFYYIYAGSGPCYNCIYRNSVGTLKEGCDSSDVIPPEAFVHAIADAITKLAGGDNTYTGTANYFSFSSASSLAVSVSKDPGCEVCSMHHYSLREGQTFLQTCGSGIKVSLQRGIDLDDVVERLPDFSVRRDGDILLASKGENSILVSSDGDILFTGYDKDGADMVLNTLFPSTLSPGSTYAERHEYRT